jgi:hypothetical protein
MIFVLFTINLPENFKSSEKEHQKKFWINKTKKNHLNSENLEIQESECYNFANGTLKPKFPICTEKKIKQKQ